MPAQRNYRRNPIIGLNMSQVNEFLRTERTQWKTTGAVLESAPARDRSPPFHLHLYHMRQFDSEIGRLPVLLRPRHNGSDLCLFF